ncbi:alginate export family protein [Novosphingobium colocasiae]|uniref:alginate export family protein n=1 Tax=Novosphingobium colocasiae TaxID=1256513 RepID=UPI0035B1552C
MKTTILSAGVLALSLAAAPAFAKPGDPIKVSDDLTIDPIVEGRLRYEHVDQDKLPVPLDADAVTMRLRVGAEFRMNNLSILVEGEGTLAFGHDYNAFPFPVPGESQSKPGVYSVIPDPETIGLNRLQFSYKNKGNGVTVGRQRINLDDQRWVGSVAWRQDEQTFDAVRGEAKVGPVSLDAIYSWGQRTIFGVDAANRQSWGGSFLMMGAGVKLGPVNLKGFGYYLDYDLELGAPLSSKTLGARATTELPLARTVKLDLMGSYARQSDYKGSKDFDAVYIAAEAGVTVSGFRLAGGYEKLGTDKGRALQTPMATLHKFNGWADVFLNTPVNGLQDAYGSASYKVGDFGAIKGVAATVVYHQFDSAIANLKYGTEWDAQVGFKFQQFSVLGKYASFNGDNSGPFALADKDVFWLQLEFAY